MNPLVGGAAAGAIFATGHAAANLRLLRRPPAAPAVDEGVSVLVPARDEAGRIGPCVAALLAQEGVPFEALVLDDGSTDGTTEVVRAVAGGNPRLRVLADSSPPPGWLGKPHACSRLADAATGSVLVFLDADVVLNAGGLAGAVATLRAAGADLVSPYPRQAYDGVGPRLVQPLLQWSWMTFLPLRLAERLPAPSLAAANGQFLVCDAAAYHRAGGHAAVRADVLEDVALARAFKRAGLRVAMADGTPLATCRMYEGWDDLVDGYTKSLWAAFGSPTGAAGILAALAWLYLLPPAAAVAGLARRRWATAAAGAGGYLAGVLGRALVARRTGGRPVDALGHPLSIAAFVGLTVASHRRRRAGALSWKGRPVQVPEPSPPPRG